MNKKGLKEDQEFDQASAGLSGEVFMWSGQVGKRPIYIRQCQAYMVTSAKYLHI